MYLNAESVTVDDDEGRFTLVIDSTEEDTITVNIHGIDLDAFYDQVKGRIGPYLHEMHAARSEYVVAVREDGSYRMETDEDAYDPTDPKHPHYHSTHADIWDAREGK